MKRTPPQRRTPLARGQFSLRRGVPLARTGFELARRAPLKAVSVKRAVQNRIRSKRVKEMAADQPMCVVPGCVRFATDPHEPLSRARGGSITDRANILPICRDHHDWAHTHPAEAEQMGLLIHSWNRGPQ